MATIIKQGCGAHFTTFWAVHEQPSSTAFQTTINTASSQRPKDWLVLGPSVRADASGVCTCKQFCLQFCYEVQTYLLMAVVDESSMMRKYVSCTEQRKALPMVSRLQKKCSKWQVVSSYRKPRAALLSTENQSQDHEIPA
eukprot:scaffold67824_cov21-Tisochrysis_lutea.AAC.1